MTQNGRSCIFCDNVRLTKEHVWAKWLRDYIPGPPSGYSISGQVVYPDTIERQIEHRQADHRNMTVRHVCEECNNGWMSQLQNLCKGIIIPLLKGQYTTLHRRRQTLLAAWICMTVMVCEYTQRDKIAVSRRDRRFLKKLQRPPSYWRIWISFISGDTSTPIWSHRVLPMVHSESDAIYDDGIPRPNSHATTIRIGDNLIVHALGSASARSIVRRWRFDDKGANRKLIQIWPIRSSIIHWPPSEVLTKREAHRITESFFNKFEMAGRVFELSRKHRRR